MCDFNCRRIYCYFHAARNPSSALPQTSTLDRCFAPPGSHAWLGTFGVGPCSGPFVPPSSRGGRVLVKTFYIPCQLVEKFVPDWPEYCLKCTKCDRLILRKITKIATTRCHIFMLKCTKFHIDWAHWELTDLRGLFLRERRGRERE